MTVIKIQSTWDAPIEMFKYEPRWYEGGDLRFAFIANDNARDATREFGPLEGVQVGDRIVATTWRQVK